MEPETQTIERPQRERMRYKDQETGCKEVGGSLNAKLNAMGHLMHIRKDGILLTRTEGSQSEGGLSRIYLRVHGAGNQVELLQLTGPGGVCTEYRYSNDTVIWTGRTEDLSIEVGFRINEDDTMDWTVITECSGSENLEVDCIFGLDLGLADQAALQSNESYVCHYVDQNVEEKPPFGPVLMYRQNLAQSESCYPWFMLYSPTGAIAYATDAHDALGNFHRISGRPQFADGSTLSSSKLQYEYNYPTLQSKREILSKNTPVEFQFRAYFQENHPEVSGQADLSLIPDEIPEPVKLATTSESSQILESFMAKALLYPSEQPDRTNLEAAYPQTWAHTEELNGQILSFFTSEHRHIVTRNKEGLIDRPHGTILIGADDFSWNTGTTATTAYMGGLFNAQLIAGNTSLHKLLSVSRESIGLNRSSGQRIFIRLGKKWYQLGTPTIFEMGRDHVIWSYQGAGLPGIKVSVSIAHNNRDVQLALSSDSTLDEVVITSELVMGNNESDLDASVVWDSSSGICDITTAAGSSSSAPGFRLITSSNGASPIAMGKFPEELGISNLLDLSFSLHLGAVTQDFIHRR